MGLRKEDLCKIADRLKIIVKHGDNTTNLIDKIKKAVKTSKPCPAKSPQLSQS